MGALFGGGAPPPAPPMPQLQQPSPMPIPDKDEERRAALKEMEMRRVGKTTTADTIIGSNDDRLG